MHDLTRLHSVLMPWPASRRARAGTAGRLPGQCVAPRALFSPAALIPEHPSHWNACASSHLATALVARLKLLQCIGR